MVAITNAVSLTFLKDELENTLNMAAARLESFQQEQDAGKRQASITACHDIFHELHGICRMLELPAATMMAEEMELAVQDIGTSDQSDALINALGNAILLLERYLEYIQIKDRELPELILDGLNDLRLLCGKAAVPESHFFSVDLTSPRSPDVVLAKIKPDEKLPLLRRMRHMYQIGLLGLLRNNNDLINLKFMLRALNRLDRLCPPSAMSRFLWVARAAVESLIRDDMAIGQGRKAMLSQYDRQIKHLIYEGDKGLNRDVPLLLLKNSVYVVSLSTYKQGVVSEVKQAFSLNNALNDQELQHERAIMSSGSAVIRTVAEALKDEMESIKQDLSYAAEGAVDTDYGQIAEALKRIANTLIMMGQPREAERVKKQAAVADSWRGATIDPAGEKFQRFADSLLVVENAVATLEKRILPPDTVYKHANNNHISLYQLDEARMAVVGECRSALSLAKRSLTTYSEGNDPMHLANLPSILSTACGGLMFLDLTRARRVLESSLTYIRERLLTTDAPKPTYQQLETLADALTSVDYFLESLEDQKPIGESVLEVAELSMTDLGYPVAAKEDVQAS